MNKTKFLIIRFSSIGDIILTSPLLRCIKNQVENAEIHFVTKSKYADLVSANPHIDKIHYLNEHIGPLIRELKDEKPDYMIDLHRNFRSFRIKRALHIPSYSFHKLNFRKWLLVKFKIDLLPNLHIVDRYFQTISKFRVTSDGKGLEYFIPQGKEFDWNRLPCDFQEGYIAFIIGGTYATKRLPAEKILHICRALPYPVVLLGGIHESENSLIIERNTGNHVLNLVGKTSIYESASLISHANVVLTNDTGMMHIAAAFGKKILSFWGNTVPKLGMFPYLPHPDSEIMQVKNLDCRPCSKLGYPKCPKKHFRCMYDQDIPAAISWVTRNFSE